jgi:hypothetical protein
MRSLCVEILLPLVTASAFDGVAKMETTMSRGRRATRRTLGALALGGALLLAVPGVAQAGYGPSMAAGAVPLPGASCVVTSQTVSLAGQRIGPLRMTGLAAVLRVGRGTFRTPVQLTVTQSAGQGGSCQSGRGSPPTLRGYRLVGDIGIVVQRGGVAGRGRYARPLLLRLSSPAIGASSLIMRWRHGRLVPVHGAVAARGAARLRVTGNASYAVLSPARLLARLLARTTAAAARTMRAVDAARRDGVLLHAAGPGLPWAGVLADR